MPICSRCSRRGGRPGSHGYREGAVASPRACRICQLRNRLGYHRVLPVPFACRMGGFHGLSRMRPAIHPLPMHTGSTSPEPCRASCRWHRPHRAHPSIPKAPVSLRRMFSRVQPAHLRFVAGDRMVPGHHPSRNSGAVFGMKANNDYQWLRRIHRYWILPAEMVSTALFIAALSSVVLLSLIGARQIVPSILCALLPASFIAGMLHHFVFYRAIRCPDCGHNPTRYKNGRNMPVKTAWKRLRDMESCPICSGSPDEPSVS